MMLTYEEAMSCMHVTL